MRNSTCARPGERTDGGHLQQHGHSALHDARGAVGVAQDALQRLQQRGQRGRGEHAGAHAQHAGGCRQRLLPCGLGQALVPELGA